MPLFGPKRPPDPPLPPTPSISGIFTEPYPATSQEVHQAQILADFQIAVRTNDQAEGCLRDAERVATQAAAALVESRRRMRRVMEGVV